jgi:hypothetical protein
MKTKSMNIDGKPVTPMHQAFSRAGFESVDAFRLPLKRYPNAAKPIKSRAGILPFNGELDALKRERHSALDAEQFLTGELPVAKKSGPARRQVVAGPTQRWSRKS